MVVYIIVLLQIMSTFVIPSGNLLNSLSLMFNTLLTRQGSLVGNVSTSVLGSNVKSSTFLCGNFLPLPLIQEEQVVSYL